jgi:hypothetical protein
MAMSHGTEGTFRLGDVFSKSFGMFGRHFVAFFLLTVIANIPNYVFQWGFAPTTPAAPGEIPTFNPWILLALPVGIVCSTIATGAMTYGVVQDLRSGPVSIGEAIAVAARRFLPMIGVAFAVGILAVLGFILLVFPLFIVMCMYFVAAPVCIAEREGVGASLRRSRFLTKGHRWQIFGALFLVLIISLIAGGAVAGAIGAASIVGATTVTIFQGAVNAVLGAFYAVMTAVFYYHLRVAKEGVDLAKIASVFD